MRIAARNVNPMVVLMPGTARPIRLRTGTLTYMFTPDEAVHLATQLADAVNELDTTRKVTP